MQFPVQRGLQASAANIPRISRAELQTCSKLCNPVMVLHKDAGAVSASRRCIQAGDLVIVYERFDSMKAVRVTPGESYGNRYGNFKLKVSLHVLT